MTVTLPCYATREEVKQALDIKQSARNDAQVDRAIDGASRAVEGLLHRVFYPAYDTRYVDWPNFDYAYPWRVWLNQSEIADITTTVPVVMSGTTTIAAGNIFWGNPRRNHAPFTYLELDRSSNESFGHKGTPQRDITITGVFGYNVDTKAGGTLAAAVSSTSVTSITVSDGTLIGIGDQLLIGTERLLVTERANTTSGQTQQGSGVSTADDADVTLAVTDGTKFFAGEVVTLDSERMLVVDVTGNNLTVIRAWDGTVLATHTSATVYVSRLLTVVRGAQGTTAATHSQGDAVYVHQVPSLVKQLTVAEATVMLTLEAGAYATTQGTEQGTQRNVGMGLPALRQQAQAQFGRVVRQRVI